jgi:hypothetical protein
MENKEEEDDEEKKKTKFVFMVLFNSVLDFMSLLFITYIYPF